jgi:hypothetical protein
LLLVRRELGYTEVSGDLSHVYCVMLAIHALKACRRKEDSVGQASHEPSARHRIETTLRLRMDYILTMGPMGAMEFTERAEYSLANGKQEIELEVVHAQSKREIAEWNVLRSQRPRVW